MPNAKSTHFLLASDIDGTLLGDESGEALLHQFTAEHTGYFTLACITGRDRASVLALIEQGRLPRPRFICGNVGTEILDLHDPSNRIGQAFSAQVDSTWDLDEVYRLGIGEGIQRQQFDGTGQPPFQAGFHWDGLFKSLTAFRQRLSHLEQIYIQTAYDTYIDVLPATLGKGNVVRFLQTQLDLSSEQVVIAGDSGNDRQMFETEYMGILPLNALDELKFLAQQTRHYHSPYPAARGVLDGLRHFGFI